MLKETHFAFSLKISAHPDFDGSNAAVVYSKDDP